MAITLEQIAKQVGVSRGTVDRALHDRPGVNKEVALRIKRVAEDLGYKPNLAGKLLSDKQYGKRLIGIIVVTENNPFYDDVVSGAKAAAEEFQEFGVSGEIRIITKYDVEEQLRVIDELVSIGASGIVMKPILSPLIDEKISELKQKGIRVVTINSDVQSSDRLAYVGCRQKKSGMVMAELLTMLTDGREMNVAVLTGTKRNLATTRREEGFFQFLAKEGRNIKITCIHANEDDSEISYEKTKMILTKYQNLDYLCILGAGISGSIQAIKEKKGGKVPKLLVYDLIEDVKQALNEKIVKATVTQEPFQQGYLGVQTMARYLAFGQYPESDVIYTELAVIISTCLN
ncbi:LacI family DNA-binding transcriptional regulator [Massilimaliae timonensis]|uniref:LacI family DNA-binding transcriptional regulator n=1 Tax=Massiliimalia timonensis TaxID=1987501 RepID=A0A8J6TR22_9FIRM|nr:LacI family DNA-binding transcriptional regulator [Massiliimalia timonensis]MBC8611814.1 LacI family DNA-binding transcriptional regulator [Massiliimalia timonensis]SCH53247.1 Cryptic asc operon repressor [uncultured Clostridium sp.]